MLVLKRASLGALALLCLGAATLLSSSMASASCELTSCKRGGNAVRCWNSLVSEATQKRKSCGQVALATGYSAYAMATSIPGVCIKSTASIYIHRPYLHTNRAVTFAVGSHWHNYYFGRIRASAVRYFTEKGGMKRSGTFNAHNTIGVPARHTGVPICKG